MPLIGFMPGFAPVAAALSLQQLLGNQAVLSLLNLDEPDHKEGAAEEGAGEKKTEGEDPKAAFTPELTDQIVSEVIADQLEKYNNIPVFIKEQVPIAGAGTDQGTMGADQPSTKTVSKMVKVRAIYFINRKKSKAKVKDARKEAGFDQIADEIDGHLSELMGGSRKKGYFQLGSGRAVEVGKATPEDIVLFISKAVSRGEIKRFGVKEGKLKDEEQLVTLGDGALTELIQDWMYATGVGVDCSGFINIALVRAREEIRDQMREAGVADEDLPKSLARLQRPQLNKKKEVTDPKDIRPGDVWVTNNKSHVRVVMRVSEGVDEKGDPVIEFVTAESTTTGATGPADKHWRTKSINKIHKIKNTAGEKGTIDGNLYRVKRAIK
jgi:hypothetical protein